jgi:hypothetical protein
VRKKGAGARMAGGEAEYPISNTEYPMKKETARKNKERK